MRAESEPLFLKLEQGLEEIIKVYRHLLATVRKEREILISAVLEELNQNNRAKEAMLLRARQLEDQRVLVAHDLAVSEGLDPEATRLLDFARHFDGERGERLRRLHSVLDLLIRRVREHNQQNEVLVKSALNNITGAMQNIRDTIGEKKTYKKGGQLQTGEAGAGQLVSREA